MKTVTIKLLFLLISTFFLQLSCKVKPASPVLAETNSYVKEENKPVKQANVNDNYVSESRLKYDDHIYDENIQTAQIYVAGDQLSFPVLYIGANQQLELHFDLMGSDYTSYSYSFEHCNANWEPSGLVMSEYIDGFSNGFIEDYDYSFNTFFPYVHYSVSFPNQDINFKVSGNYIIKVYANNDEEDLVLTKRFYVVDRQVGIKSNIHMATLARYRDYKQEIDFVIDHSSYAIQDPYNNLKVIISQNRRFDNALTNLKPQFVKSPELIYNYEDNNLFDGNNEYRFFDAKNLRYQSMNVDGIQIIAGKTHLYVLPEEPRSFKRYYFQQDLNGNRLIKRDNSTNFNKDADYMITHFNLKRETKVPNGDVYLYGALSDWQFKADFKMEYVDVNNEYTLTTKLKQGYYNYNYVFLPKGSEIGDMAVIEGTHSETSNDYYFFVYHRKVGEIYDRLIGFDIKKSNSSE